MICDVHMAHASGKSHAEIAAKFELSTIAVQALIRAEGQPSGLLTPYGFRRGPLPQNAAVQMYWLGYIAATGRVFCHGSLWTLVLAIHPMDEPHVHLMLKDLVLGHARVEFADSNRDGRQAYVRDRQLAEVLLHWGIAAEPGEGSVALEFVPTAFIPDFVRGYLEGSRTSPPFGGNQQRAPTPRSLRALSFVGPASLLTDLGRAMHGAFGIRVDEPLPARAPRAAQITLSRTESTKVLSSAYREPVRTGPRAAAFAAWFQAQPPGERRRRSRERAGVAARS
jgi:hypothetical protein